MKVSNYPCVVAHPSQFHKDQVDARVKERWEGRFGRPVPFGNLRKLWREEHCAELNPYTSTTCPYTEENCSLAFLQAVSRTVDQARDKRHASGYFRAVARSSAFRRADEKPLARDHATQGPSDTGVARPGDRAGFDTEPAAGQDELAMRRRLSRPDAIGSLLASLDLGPRQGPADDGEAGTE